MYLCTSLWSGRVRDGVGGGGGDVQNRSSELLVSCALSTIQKKCNVAHSPTLEECVNTNRCAEYYESILLKNTSQTQSLLFIEYVRTLAIQLQQQQQQQQ